MAKVTIFLDGKELKAPSGSLLIDVCKNAGVEIPSFCYYPGFSLQGACRMCLVEIEKMPKLQTACTTPIADGMKVSTQTATVRQARKAMLEFVLENHPLDCPVCDAGGQCELQDATFTYGASESKLVDIKNHRDEQQWSPIVFFDRPRCIMCYRCVRVCGEGMDVWALGIANRNSSQLIVPNKEDHLECEECGMCIDICPVGALTSGPYRYKTRPWEMKHVATVCTHCGDGCTTTLGTRPVEGRVDIMRGSNRDKGGINGDFLCIKGRYAFDFVNHPDRITAPLVGMNGSLQPASWERALSVVAAKFEEACKTEGSIGVIGSNHTTNEENYILQKFARTILRTNNIDHRRTADYPSFFQAITGIPNSTASMSDLSNASSILLIGSDPTYWHPLVAWQIRNNSRLNRAHLYVVNSRKIKLCRQAVQSIEIPEKTEADVIEFLASGRQGKNATSIEHLYPGLRTLCDSLDKEKDFVILFGPEVYGESIASLVAFGSRRPHCKFVCLSDGANSHGAADMGLLPDLLPGYESDPRRWSEFWKTSLPAMPGLNLRQMFEAARQNRLPVLYVIGSDPVADYGIDPGVLQNTFVVAQDLFLTQTAALVDVVLPSCSAYEKSGTFTNTCGDLQRLNKAADCCGPRTDLEIILNLARRMGLDAEQFMGNGESVRSDLGQSRGAQSGEADQQYVWMAAHRAAPRVSRFDPDRVLREIQQALPGFAVPQVAFANLTQNESAPRNKVVRNDTGLEFPIHPYDNDLFSSQPFGIYSATLNLVLEKRLLLPYEAGSQGE